MELVTLRKKLSTYLSDKGHLRNVSNEVLFEVITAWEEWKGTPKDFYRAIGFSHKKMAFLIGKAKKLKREGHFGDPHFKELQLHTESLPSTLAGPAIEITWDGGKVIRFAHVDQLLEFIKKAS